MNPQINHNDKKYLEISRLTKSFPGAAGPAVIVEDFDLPIRRGEFVTLIGHSGCGKSTVLSIVAGLTGASEGGVILDGREVTEPGTDRGVVFQSPCLLPWMTAFENVMLAVAQAWPNMPRKRRGLIVDHYLRLVGLEDAGRKKPAELSQGMRQRVGLARAFSLSPKVLLLDEPFGMLDSLTRMELQEVLIELWSKEDGGAAPGQGEVAQPAASGAPQGGTKTALMVTHDVDEALFLSDRIAMMTSGPRARLGGVIEVPFARPRNRTALLEDPRYYELRDQLIGFLNGQAHPPDPADDDAAAPATVTKPATAPEETVSPAVTANARASAA